MKIFINEKADKEYRTEIEESIRKQLPSVPVEFATFITPRNFGFDETLKDLDRLKRTSDDDPSVYIAHTTLYLTDAYLVGIILFYTHGEIRRFVLGITPKHSVLSTLQSLLSNLLTPKSS